MTATSLSRGESGLAAVAPALSGQFAEAAAGAGTIVERTYRIAGRNLRLRYAGPALVDRLSPSIEHLRADTDGADEHEVEIWDGKSTGTEPPPAPVGSEDLPIGGVATSGGGDRRAIYQVGLDTLSVIDERLNRSWYWAADAGLLPEWECSTPLRHILHLVLAARGAQFVHAGAVGRPSGGFIICGRSGSGKSSSTLSTLGSELLFAGDDCVAATLEPGGAPYVHSVYGCAKLETHHVQRFPRLRFDPRQERPGTVPADRDKTMFYVRDTYPRQLTTGFPLRGIIIPRVSPDEPTSLTDIPLSVALRALLPSTMFEFHGTGQEAFSILTRAAQQVRTLELRLGADMDVIPDLLGAELDRAAERLDAK